MRFIRHWRGELTIRNATGGDWLAFPELQVDRFQGSLSPPPTSSSVMCMSMGLEEMPAPLTMSL